MRTCTGCREVVPQATLVRLVLDNGELVATASGAARAPGRGAYVHARASCLDAAARGGLARSFRKGIPAEAVRRLAASLSPTGDNPSQTRAGLMAEDAVETPPRRFATTREG